MKKLIFTFLSIVFISLLGWWFWKNYFSLVNIVIIDPGHGGLDSGATVTANGKMFSESAYAFDVACRLGNILEANKVKVIYTTTTLPTGHVVNNADYIPGNQNQTFSDGAAITSGTSGLQHRINIGIEAMKKYRVHHVYFIALHFDASETLKPGAKKPMPNTELYGAHTVAPWNCQGFADLIVQEFRAWNLVRCKYGSEYFPLTISGDKEHGVRNLYVLRDDTNPIRCKILIELGNLFSPIDISRIQDPVTRERYAMCIAEAIHKDITQKPPSGK